MWIEIFLKKKLKKTRNLPFSTNFGGACWQSPEKKVSQANDIMKKGNICWILNYQSEDMMIVKMIYFPIHICRYLTSNNETSDQTM